MLALGLRQSHHARSFAPGMAGTPLPHRLGCTDFTKTWCRHRGSNALLAVFAQFISSNKHGRAPDIPVPAFILGCFVSSHRKLEINIELSSVDMRLADLTGLPVHLLDRAFRK